MEADMNELTNEKLQLDKIVDQVRNDQCGGIDVFIGTVRNATEEREVRYLDFEAYESMALSEMNKISEQAKEKFEINNMAIHHRLGRLEIGEEAVIIAASAPHRDAAFLACRFAIDTLKKTVPIWKKEVFVDGEVWVSVHP